MPESTKWSSQQRLAEVYRRLSVAPRVNSAEDALRMVCVTLEQVEDELSGLPKQTPPPSFNQSDGRMYCPLEDHIQRRDDGSIMAITRGHRIEIGANGTIRILNRFENSVEFET